MVAYNETYKIPEYLPELPENSKKIITDIQSGEILGASRSIRLINDVFCTMVEKTDENSGKELAKQIRFWADYLIETRGALSPAVGNAIESVLKGLEDVKSSDSVDDIRTFVHHQTKAFNDDSVKNIDDIANSCANLLKDRQTVVAYDYSSSVNFVLKKAFDQGKCLHVIIPESRALNGGIPIFQEVINWGHDITFTVDVAMGQELKMADAVLVGAESLTADGGFWNTIGTCSLAILAEYFHVPFYVPTELIKFDKRSIQGVYRNVARQSITIFEFDEFQKLPERVKIESNDLEFTKRGLVTAYITEKGLLSPEVMPEVAKTIFL